MRGTPKWDQRGWDPSMIDVKKSEHQWKFQIRHELSSYGRETLFSIFSIGMGEEFNHGEQNSYERGRGACFSLCISAWWIGAVYHIISGSARTVVWRKNTAAFGEQTNTRALCLGSHLSKQGGRKKKWNVKHYWQPKRKICECNVALRCLVCWLIRLRARHMAGHEWLLILQTLNVWLIWISGTGSNRCCGICLCSDFNGGCRRWLAIYWSSAPIALAIQFVKKRVDLTIVRDRGKLGLVVAFNYK